MTRREAFQQENVFLPCEKKKNVGWRDPALVVPNVEIEDTKRENKTLMEEIRGGVI